MVPFPVFELERIRELRDARILDSGPTPEFDAIVEHVRDLFGVPISLISLMDADRQWFKAKCGLDACGTSRDIAFCNYALMSDEVFIVDDAARDPRFKGNPLVTGAPHIRFYAGAPLTLRPGIALGTLCVIGTEPRHVTAKEQQTLARLAKVATGLIRGHSLAQKAARLADDAHAKSVTVQEQARELELRERRFQQTETMARVGGWELDLATKVVTWSNETYRICDIPVDTPVNLDLATSVYPPQDRMRLQAAIERTLRDRTGFSDEFEIVTASGIRKWVRAVGDVEVQDGAPKRLFGIFQDVTDGRRAAMRLWESANRDALTGLANRNCFDRELNAAFLAPSPPGFLMVDADHLKDINDTLGHEAGDLLIQTIARRLRDAVGGRGTVARIGGDEFAVLVQPPIDQDGMRLLANGLLSAVAPPIDFKGGSIKPQVSIGGGLGCAEAGPEALRQNADLGLYHAKEIRRGGYVAFHDGLRSAVTARISAITIVDEALSNGDVVAWYQPIVDTATGRVSGLEALARVIRGDAIHSIGEFAHALQDRGIATRLTSCMLQRIEEDVKRWRASGIAVPRIAVNAGSADFLEGSLTSMILATCERAGIAPSGFALEVTETVFLSRDADIVAQTAAQLRDKGVLVALDDFGTGYASLAHLSTFPVDVIKMDRAFVARITDDGPGSIITSALIELAHRLDIQVVAEGVETPAQMQRLLALGCEMVQGYFISHPLPASGVGRFLAGRLERTSPVFE